MTTTTPPLDTPEQITAEVAWLEREARELSDDDLDRQIAYNTRRRRLFEATYARACPSWCVRHYASEHPTRPQDSAMTHQGVVVVGQVEVQISKEDDDKDGTVVWMPELDWANGQELDDVIEALTQARALVAQAGGGA